MNHLVIALVLASAAAQLSLKTSGGGSDRLMLGAGATDLGAGHRIHRETPDGDGTIQDVIKGQYDLSRAWL